MIIDVVAVRSLADLYRREQAAGRCLDPDQAAATAVSHLQALGYRGPAGRGTGTPPALRTAAPAHVPVLPGPILPPDPDGSHPDAEGTTLARP